MERAEALAQVLGQPYVHLGMNMPATAFTDGAPGGFSPAAIGALCRESELTIRWHVTAGVQCLQEV